MSKSKQTENMPAEGREEYPGSAVNDAVQNLHVQQAEAQKAAMAAAWGAMERPAEPADDRISVTVRLKPRHHDYLVQRGQMNDRTPEQELEAILRDFRSYHDPLRPDQAHIGGPEVGMPAAARRVR